MLRSLEKLKSGAYFPQGKYKTADNEKGDQLADEIQAEVDKFYLPRPLFEDGEPVQFGDRVSIHSGASTICVSNITLWDNGACSVGGFKGSATSLDGGLLKRPEPDTQEKIDADAILQNATYCIKHNIVYDANVETNVRKHLLARQRKLDGVE